MNHNSAELKQMARANLSDKWNPALGLTALHTLITFALSQCITLFQSTNALGTTVYLIVNLIVSLLTTLFSVGASFFYLNICRGREYKLGNLFAAFKMNPDRFLIVALIQNLLVLSVQLPLVFQPMSNTFKLSDSLHIITITAVCSIAAALVSMIFSMFFGISYYLMLDFPELEAMGSLRLSVTLMRGNKWRYFYIFALSFIGWKFLGNLSFGLGYLWITPYINMTLTYFYCDVLEQLKEAEDMQGFEVPETEYVDFNSEDNLTNACEETVKTDTSYDMTEIDVESSDVTSEEATSDGTSSSVEVASDETVTTYDTASEEH